MAMDLAIKFSKSVTPDSNITSFMQCLTKLMFFANRQISVLLRRACSSNNGPGSQSSASIPAKRCCQKVYNLHVLA